VRDRAYRAEDGDQGIDDRRARLRGVPRPCREPARRRGRGLPDRDADPRPVAAGRRRAGARDRSGRDRLRARIREDAGDDAQADRAASARRCDARGHGDEVRGRARAALQVRAGGRRGNRRPCADEALRDDEALLHGRRDGGDDGRRAGARRLRVHPGVSAGADDARREDHADLRGHQPNPAPRDRAGNAEGAASVLARRSLVKLDGIHHITCITGDAPQNVDFYTRVLGLRLVKKSVNQDDPTVYHLFYADERGDPGSDITFFEYPGAAPGRAGPGMVHLITWRVQSDEALTFWAERLAGEGVETARDGSRLSFADPEGLALELAIVTNDDAPLVAEHPEIPAELALQGFDSVRAYSADPERSRGFLEETLGFESRGDNGWECRGDNRGSFYAYDAPPP